MWQGGDKAFVAILLAARTVGSICWWDVGGPPFLDLYLVFTAIQRILIQTCVVFSLVKQETVYRVGIQSLPYRAAFALPLDRRDPLHCSRGFAVFAVLVDVLDTRQAH